MKINTALYGSLLMLFTLSCSSEDSENTPEEKINPAVGVWVMTEIKLDKAIDNNNDSVFSTNLLDELECLFVEYEFKEDGSWSSEGNSLDVSYDDQNEVTFDCGTYVNNNSGVWLLEGDQLNLGNNDIVTLNGNEIIREVNNDFGFEQITYSKK